MGANQSQGGADHLQALEDFHNGVRIAKAAGVGLQDLIAMLEKIAQIQAEMKPEDAAAVKKK